MINEIRDVHTNILNHASGLNFLTQVEISKWHAKGEREIRKQKIVLHYNRWTSERILVVDENIRAIEKLLKIIKSFQIWTRRSGHIEILIKWVSCMKDCVGALREEFEILGEELSKNLGVVKI